MRSARLIALFVLLILALWVPAETDAQVRFASASQPPSARSSVSVAEDVQLAARLDVLAEDGFAGVVLVAEGERILLHEARGAASAIDPVRTGTAYDLGGLAKAFTNAAILQLEADGQLRLSDPVGRYVRGLPRATRRLTLGDLLHERAGFGMATLALYRAPMRLGEVARAVGGAPLRHERGTYAPSDLGHVLLAAVVERASGRDFADYLRARVLPSAGLVETELPTEAWRNAAYTAEAGADARTLPRPVWTTGIGGVRMTVADLWRWTRHVAQTPRLAALGPCGVAGGVCHSARGGFEAVVEQRAGRMTIVLTNVVGQGEAVAGAFADAPRTVADSLR